MGFSSQTLIRVPVNLRAAQRNIWPRRGDILFLDILLSRHKTRASIRELSIEGFKQIMFHALMPAIWRSHVVEFSTNQFQMEALFTSVHYKLEQLALHRNTTWIVQMFLLSLLLLRLWILLLA